MIANSILRKIMRHQPGLPGVGVIGHPKHTRISPSLERFAAVSGHDKDFHGSGRMREERCFVMKAIYTSNSAVIVPGVSEVALSIAVLANIVQCIRFECRHVQQGRCLS